MPVVIRYATPDDFAAVAELDGTNFGIHYDEPSLADARLELAESRIAVAEDAGRIVGVSAELPYDMTLPGGAPVPVTGLTWVSVEVTHRRRGLLRRLVEGQARDRAAAGDAALILTASEGGIYGRYGFGVATATRRSVVRRGKARLATAVDASAVRRLTSSAARDILPGLHERWRALTPGAISRGPQRWDFQLLESEWLRRGRSALSHLVHPDGYVSYRIAAKWGEGDPQHECSIVDYAPVSAEAHAALWQTLLALDLVGTIESDVVPLDDPLPLLLTDPRSVDTTHLGDGLWVRPLDVPAVLGRRRYAAEIDCVLQIRDALLGPGRYQLSGGPDGAECRRVDRAADVELDIADLGAVSLGGVRLARLVRAGRVSGDPKVLRRLDLALPADRDPLPGTQF